MVLNWNGKSDTLACLESLRVVHAPRPRVIVVDNGSSDGSVAAVRAAFPEVEVIETGQNLGYAGGNNIGIRRALELGADYVLLLNNDTVIDPSLLGAFVDASRRYPNAAALGGKIYFHSEPNRVWCAGGLWRPEEGWFRHLGGGLQDHETVLNKVEEVDYASGCAMFASAEMFRKVGLLDERFFLMFEETDWCYRARRLGHSSLFIPTAKLWHKVSVSFGGDEAPLATYFMTRNRLLWARLHLPRRERWRLYRRAFGELVPVIVGPKPEGRPWLKHIVWSIHTFAKSWPRLRALPFNRARWMGVADFILGRFGGCERRITTLRAMTPPKQQPARHGTTSAG